MPDALHDWLSDHHRLLWWMGIASLLTFVGTLVIVPVLIVRIPTDYFVERRRRKPQVVVARIGKNVVGAVFVVAGVAMLLLPGQGLITMLIGIMLLDLPGKRRLERWLIGRTAVLRSVNWMRRKANRPPLRV
ncbi:MAG: hypothetical protein CMJ18_13890 [Phycisphaeraceae bacterium]|nr:hypothetical protein [Phycisphaeraceae bacterium]